MVTQVEKKQTKTVMPFTVMADHPRNADLVLACLEGSRMRSQIKHNKSVFARNKKTGEQEERPTSAKLIEGLPANIPGMTLHIDPVELKYEITDPLAEDEEKLEQIQAAIHSAHGVKTGMKLRPAQSKFGTLDKHRMKTLVREVLTFVGDGAMKCVEGILPELEDVNAMDGKYLQNPSNRGQYNQPKFEEDMPEWIDSLNRIR